MKVRALITGIYKNQRRHPGAVFVLDDPKEKGRWMQIVPDDTPTSDGVRMPSLGHLLITQRITDGQSYD